MNLKVKVLLVGVIFLLCIGLLVGCSEDTQKTFKLITEVMEGQGAIKKKPDKESYEKNTEVTLTAVPDNNYEFKNWTGNLEGQKFKKTITITEDMTVGAKFNKITTLDKKEIKNQLITWAQACETEDRDKLQRTMVSEGIWFTHNRPNDNFEKKNLTIDKFINFITDTVIVGYKNDITVDSINISKETAVLSGKLKVETEQSIFEITNTIEFVNKDKWLIKEITWNEIEKKYKGEAKEPFDPERHNSYVSFKADGELYVFHDQYGGYTPEMSSICTYNNCFSIDVYNHDNERMILDFGWQGEDAGQFRSVTWRPTDDWDSAFEYAADNFTANMDTYDLSGGLVKGTFSGKIANEQGETVNITDGFFYVKHEFNLPQVTIKKPVAGDTVAGEVTVSGTTDDDSEIIDVSVSVVEKFGTNPEDVIDRKDANGTNDWEFSFDSTKYSNGEYNIEVFARDKHYNYSKVKTVTVNISN